MKEMGTLESLQDSEFFISTHSCSFNTDMAVIMYSLPFLCLVTIALKSNPCPCEWKLMSLIHYCQFSFSLEIALKGRARGFFLMTKIVKKYFLIKVIERKCFLISL